MDSQTNLDPAVEEATRAVALEILCHKASDRVGLQDALETLANGSRRDGLFRRRLAESGVLRNLIAVIDVELSYNDMITTVVNALRCIGNACIDNDDARSSVANQGFEWAIKCLRSVDPEISETAVKAVYNICNDYEPAQKQCYRSKLHFALIELCSSRFKEAVDQTLPIDLLFSITGHKAQIEPTLDNTLSTELIHQLLKLPQFCPENSSAEIFGTLMEAVLDFLLDATIQKQIIDGKLLEHVWIILKVLQSRITGLRRTQGNDAEDAQLLKPVGIKVIWCLSDMAASTNFATKYPLDDPTIGLLLDEIKAGETTIDAAARSSQEALLDAACQIVGNLVNVLPADPGVFELIEAHLIHDHLFAFVVRPGTERATAAFLHSAANLLIQLTRHSVAVREVMGSNQRCLPALRRLCNFEVKDVRDDGIHLLKALGKECPVNRERFADLATQVAKDQRDTAKASLADAE